MTGVRKFIPYLLALLLPAMQLSHAVEFKLKGWEYQKQLDLGGAALSSEHRFFTAHTLGEKIIFFYCGQRSLSYVIFDGRGTGSPEVISAVDPYTRPVIKVSAGELYILLSREGGRQLLYKMDKSLKLILVRDFQKRLRYFNDFFVSGTDFFFTTPEYKNGKYSISLYIWQKGSQEMSMAEFPPPRPNEKGLFFPQIIDRGGTYDVFYIIKEFNEGDNILNDSIYRISTSDLRTLKTQTPLKIRTTGFINYPPYYVTHNNDLYILYTSKERAILNLKLYSFQDSREYLLSSEYVNAFNINVFKKGRMLDLFYVSFTPDSASISWRRVDLGLAAAGAMTREAGSQATDKKSMVKYFSLASLGKDRFIFYTDESFRRIYFTRTDRSAPLPQIEMTIKPSKSLDKNYVDFYWEPADDPSGVRGYSYVVDRENDTIPTDMNLLSSERFISTKLYPKARYYLHLRTIDSLDNISRVTHYPFTVGPYKPLVSRRKIITMPEDDDIQIRPDAVKSFNAYASYLKQSDELIEKGDYFRARKYINLASILEPGGIETFILMQKIHKAETSFTYRYKYIFIFTLLVIISFALALQSLRIFNR